MLNAKSLFLSQSYIDCCTEYDNSLAIKDYDVWDFVVITASNEEQAINYRVQIDKRLNKKMLCARTKYIVIPDTKGMRVGSGGATLNVLGFLNIHYGISDFTKYKILLIHSGGDSKRIPQFSACGKLFSPVPRLLNNGSASTIFDEFIITTSSISTRIKCGMLVMSGDVLLLFNPLQIDFGGCGAGALSIKAKANIGKNHGVFLSDNKNNVIEFLHKKPVFELMEKGAVSDGNVDIDTGAILLGGDLINSMFSLIANGAIVAQEKCDAYINDRVRLSFYGDFVYLLAENVTLKGYLAEDSEGVYSEELLERRKEIWSKIYGYKMNAIKLFPSEFIHFGTTREYLNLCCSDIVEYSFLGWQKEVLTNARAENYMAYNSLILDSQIGGKSLIENSELRNCVVSENSIISNLKISNATLPNGVVLHGIFMGDSKYVTRIYGIDDNPKIEFSKQYFGNNVEKFLMQHNIQLTDIFDSSDHSLWSAKLFPICDSIEESMRWAIKIYDIFNEKASKIDINEWLSCERTSLLASFVKANMSRQIAENDVLTDKIIAHQAIEIIVKDGSYNDFENLFCYYQINNVMMEEFSFFLGNASLTNKIRMCHYLSKITKNTEFEIAENKSFGIIRDALIAQANMNQKTFKFAKAEYSCDLPVRVNWGGGWTDTPPYCIDNGGTVINCAIKLNGQLPIKITAKKLKEKVIRFECFDINLAQDFNNSKDILYCNNPIDSFALHKACLVAMGVIKKGDNLQDVLESLGGGIYLATDVLGIPRGSGLGTSSILAGGCVKALFEVFGCNYSYNDIYDTVLLMEQLMSTGGGWQDQIGGLSAGIKFITSNAGIVQNMDVVKVELDASTVIELNNRFALIYTGQRRLARNLLRKVMGNYIERVEKSVMSFKEIEYLACQMSRELQRGDIDAFAKLLNRHWEFSKMLDSGTSNTCIEHIFNVIEDVIDGKMICGAGGGGFLQVIIKKGYTKEDLQQRLKDGFADSGVCLWDSELYIEA